MKEPELKPCPFCGATASVHIDTPYGIGDHHEEDGTPSTDGFHVNCSYTDDGCGATGCWGQTREEAAAAWNRRAGE